MPGNAIVHPILRVDPIIEEQRLDRGQAEFLVIHDHDSLGATFLDLEHFKLNFGEVLRQVFQNWLLVVVLENSHAV